MKLHFWTLTLYVPRVILFCRVCSPREKSLISLTESKKKPTTLLFIFLKKPLSIGGNEVGVDTGAGHSNALTILHPSDAKGLNHHS